MLFTDNNNLILEELSGWGLFPRKTVLLIDKTSDYRMLKDKLKIFNTKEKYLKGDKFIVYTICPIENKNQKPISLITKSKNDQPFIISFD